MADAQTFQSFNLTHLDGLPSSEVSDIAQAPDGRIWFATRLGLAAYDGTEWEYPAISSDEPLDYAYTNIEVDARGRVWFTTSTPSKELAYLQNGACVYVPSPPVDTWLRLGRDMCLLQADGRLSRIAIMHAGRILLWDESSWSIVRDSGGQELNRAQGILAVDDELHIATANGVERLPAGKTTCVPWPIEHMPTGAVLGLTWEPGTGSAGRMWILGDGWMGYIEGDRFTPIEVELPEFERLYQFGLDLLADRRGGLYVGVGSELWHYDDERHDMRAHSSNEGFASTGASSMLFDRDRNFWISSIRGVTRIPAPIFANYGRRQGLLQDEVSAILELQDGTLAIGHNHGLSFLGPREIETVDFRALDLGFAPTSRVSELHLDSDGNLWFPAHRRGFGRYDSSQSLSWIEHAASTSANSLCIDSNGRWWVVNGSLLSELDGNEFKSADGVPEGPIRRVQAVRDGTVFALSHSQGLYVRRDGEWQNVQSTASRETNNVYCVMLSTRGETLVGTAAGLLALRGEELVPHESLRIDSPLYAIKEDDRGRLWFGTRHGVRRWDGRELRSYNVLDGLSGDEVNRAALIQDSKGRIWIGTELGLSRYIEENDHPPIPPVARILQAKTGENEVQFDTPFELANHSDLTFRFRATSFAGNGRSLYRARLLGYEEDWVGENALSGGEVRYTNLPPGEYHFEVQARTRTSDWGPVASSATLTIATPFWRSWWFVGSILVASISLVCAGAALLSARRQSSRLEHLVAARTRALEETERRYREMFERNPAIQLLLDPQTARVIDANPAAGAFFKSTTEDLIGRTFSSVTGWDEAHIEQELASIGDEESQALIEARDDGASKRPALEIRLGNYDLGGDRVVQATVYNIETRVQLENELLKAQKLRAIGLLAGGVAHDFNNLLTAILGHGELIGLEAKNDEAIQRHVDHIRQAGDRGADLVKQLLVFGRRQFLREEILDPNTVIRDVTEILSGSIGPDIKIELDLGNFAGFIRVDRSQLERALTNLAVNARDAMPQGGHLRIETRLAKKEEMPAVLREICDDQTFVLISIQDSGRGMTAEQRARMFEPFFTTKEVGDGAGLGLSMVHGIVGQSGGTIDVISAPNKGTVVNLFWPMVVGEDLEPRHVQAPADSVPPRSRATTVLLVDDDSSVRHAATLMLHGLGYRVIVAQDAKSALDLFDRLSEEIDLLLTDIRMPGQSGWKLADTLRLKRPGFPVILMSGYDSASVSTNAYPFLSKPFSAQELGETIQSVLAKATAAEPGHVQP